MSDAGLLTGWARLLLGSLRAAGVRRVVISPGSRSTPFAWAALQDPGLDCRIIVDERCAGFFAVGQARITGEPALLICTSGTAAANYFPAVVEAAESATPLLVLTADRPLELQRGAAAQTVDQVKLYGDQVRAFFELGTPDPDLRALRSIPRLAAQAVLASRHPTPGPVHLNARARKPLEPVYSGTAGPRGAPSALSGEVDRLIAAARGAAPPASVPDPAAVRELTEAARGADRGLIVCGPAQEPDAVDAAALAELAEATGFPVVAEAASQRRFGAGPHPPVELDALMTLLEVDGLVEGARPDLVIRIGRPPTSSAWRPALERWGDVDRWVLAPRGWPDPRGGARLLVGGTTATARALTAGLRDGPADSGSGAGREWRDRLADLNERAWRIIDGALPGAGLTEGAAVRAVIDGVPPGSTLALGNSLPIREADLFVRAADRGLHVWSQRGANGIDGLVSGAAGAAMTGRPTTLLLGDVSFLHDLGGLAAARRLPAPLTVVVLNNGGGRIFERLPLFEQRGADPSFEAWLTPPGIDIGAAARAFGLEHTVAEDPASLTDALERPAGSGGEPAGARIVEVQVADGGTTAHQRAIRQRLAAELAR